MSKKKKAAQEPVEPETGSSKFTFRNGAEYTGEWQVDPASGKKQRHGQGTWTCNGESFSGEWTNDVMSHGRYEFASGSVYEGEFSAAGLFDGRGRLTFANGAWYEGDWQANKMHGQGVFCDADGHRFKGTFHNDRFDNGHGEWISPQAWDELSAQREEAARQRALAQPEPEPEPEAEQEVDPEPVEASG